MMWRIRLVLYASIGSIFMQPVCGILRGEPTEHRFQTTGRRNDASGRFFFGTSADAKLGTLAWLFYVDRQNHSGQIFVPPRMLKLSKLDINEDGTIGFQSEVFLGRYYRFQGTMHQTEIEGKMELTNSKSGTVRSTWQIRASQLSNGGPGPTDRTVVRSGHFSNVNYSGGGGDLVGTDLRILATATGSVGMVVFYESYWGEITFTPFAISHLENDGAVIRFAIETPKGPTNYHLRTTGNEALLYRDDMKGGKGVALRSVKTLLPPLSR
jgi:hypothetical protein